jgi:hypothetical protein
MAEPLTIDQFMEIATPEQAKLLREIVKGVRDEHKLAREIDGIYSAPVQGGIYSGDGFSITPCEDEDDAAVISAKPRRDITHVRAQMKVYMQEAVELGMTNVGLIQRQYEHFVGEPLPE